VRTPDYCPNGKLRKYSGLPAEVCIETMGLGKNLSQCVLCHELFSTERNFVSHRVEKTVGNTPGTYFLGPCRDPRLKGLALSNRGVWKMAPSVRESYGGQD
jgi:hypothetical protein